MKKTKTRKDVSQLVKRARTSLRMNGGSQQALLRRAREILDLTNDELGKALGVKLGTLMAYLAPEGAAKHRTMPADLRLIVERVIEQQSAKSRK
jgi:DNA-binding XRE family transcriptional regulator